MKVGDYVRYKYENYIYIGKIKFISEVMSRLDETLQLDIDNCMEEILKEDIVKSSPNIIDLIQVGDYVNGRLVHDNLIYLTEFGWVDFDTLEQTDTRQIKSIVTKEQFSCMEYKIGE